MSIEAMKQALEALEEMDSEDAELNQEWLGKKAIAALRAAIEQAEKPNEDYERGFVDGMQEQMKSSVDRAVNAMCKRGKEPYDQTALELCKECGWRALIPGEGCLTCARQKAKPVAWVESPHGAIRANPLYKIPVPQSATWSIPLYAHPPTTPRQWVGLTDEEVDEFYWISALTVEAIEAKLKEKNT